jgi:hypothetical protein
MESIDDAVERVGRRFDEVFAESLVKQAAFMARCGVSREDAKLLLDRQAASYQTDRAECLDRARGWFLRCRGRLN